MSTLSDRRMTRADADVILTELHTKFPNLEIIPAGSYRREKDSFGDLDLCVVVPDLYMIRPQLEEIFEIHSGGSKRILSLHRKSLFQVDFYATTEELKEAMLLTLTGNAETNITMRSKAKYLGMKLNQYGLFKDTVLISATERGIFETLGMQYLEPRDRNMQFVEHAGQ